MDELDAIFGQVRHHVATKTMPFPDRTNGITWVWAANGVFKLGVTDTLALAVCVREVHTPGLAVWRPFVTWFKSPFKRLPTSRTLVPILQASMAQSRQHKLGSEAQFFVVPMTDGVDVVYPDQKANAMRVEYKHVPPSMLCDVHSHHNMPAYFSNTDDTDDGGCTVSVVIGTIFERPQVLCRLNCWGHRQVVPMTDVFDDVLAFDDRYEEYARDK